jgi:hypothetical protein
MNKKAGNPITLFFWVISAIIVYAFVAAPWLTYHSQRIIAENTLGGFEAFLWGNINVIVIGIAFIFMVAYAVVGN